MALMIPIPSAQGIPPRKRIQVQPGFEAEILHREPFGPRAAGPNQPQVQPEVGLSSIHGNPGHVVHGRDSPILGDKGPRDLDHGSKRIGLFHLHLIFAPGPHAVSVAPTLEGHPETAAIQDPRTRGEIVAPVFVHPDLVQQLLGRPSHHQPEGPGNHFHPPRCDATGQWVRETWAGRRPDAGSTPLARWPAGWRRSGPGPTAGSHLSANEPLPRQRREQTCPGGPSIGAGGLT